MLVHVDGDVICYRAGYAAEHTMYHVHYKADGKQETKVFDGAAEYKDFLASSGFGPLDYLVENEVVVEDESAAIYNVNSIIRAIADDLQVDLDSEVRVYLSGETNYRLSVGTIKPYKGNRDPTRKPVHAPAIKQYIRNKYDCQVSDGQEADDDMAIAHYAMWERDPESTVIATIDKDLNTIPGKHYNFVTKAAYYVTPEEANKFFWTQMIAGDPTDNVPGIPKYGMGKAEKALMGWDGATNPDIVDMIRTLYVQSYGEKWEDAMTEMGRLLYIRKRPDEWWEIPNALRGQEQQTAAVQPDADLLLDGVSGSQ